MKADFAILAEYASGPPDGKLYMIGGGIRRIMSPSFPTLIPTMSIVVGLRVPPAECGTNHELRFSYLDPDGGPLVAPPPFIVNAAFNPDSRTLPAFVNVVANLQGLPVPKPGDYAFSLVWAEQELVSVGFRAVLQSPAGPAVTSLSPRR
jgi:hypothetical protein